MEPVLSASRSGQIIQPGEYVLLLLADGKQFLLRTKPGKSYSTHHGTVYHNDIIGHQWGTVVLSTSKRPIHILRPRSIDRMMQVHRKTNIMYPKDVFYLIAEMDLHSGNRVVELGSGSGAMTQALARAVSPGGTVFTYDLRPEFSKLARTNCRNAGCSNIEFRLRCEGEPLEPAVDAVFSDVPEPWRELGAIRNALVGSGRFAAGVPTYNQAETLVGELECHDFGMVECMEIFHRRILAREGKTRPDHRMTGHTQVLVTAVKLGSDSAPSLSEEQEN